MFGTGISGEMVLEVKDLEIKPTLQSICLNKIVSSLLLTKTVLPFIDRDCDWSVVEPYLLSHVRHASLPEWLKKMLLVRLKPTFTELRIFSRGQRFGLDRFGCRWHKRRVLECVTWNPDGILEWSRLAKNIVKNPIHFGLNFKDGFEIACLFCFETELERMWNERQIDLHPSTKDPMPVRYWIHRLRNQLNLLEAEINENHSQILVHPVYYQLFEYAYHFGTRQAMQYAYARLTSVLGHEKVYVNFWGIATNWYWLISKISVDEMVENMSRNPAQMLSRVELDCPWPYLPVFEELIRRVWNLEHFTLENHVSFLKGLASYCSGPASPFLIFAWEEAPDVYRDYAHQNPALVRKINKLINWAPDVRKRNLYNSYLYWSITSTDIIIGCLVIFSVSLTSISPFYVLSVCPLWLLSSWFAKVCLL